MKEVAELKKIMKEHGLSLEKVARELGVSFRTVFRWLHGENKPTGVSLIMLKNFVNTMPDYYVIPRLKPDSPSTITVHIKKQPPQKHVLFEVPIQIKSEEPETIEVRVYSREEWQKKHARELRAAAKKQLQKKRKKKSKLKSRAVAKK